MPSGIVHNWTSIVAAVVGGGGLWATGLVAVPNAAAFTGGCLAGVLLSPDLDLLEGSRSDRVARHLFGFAGRVWRLLWLPYALIIGRHRSSLSHAPLIGTAGRLLYLAVFVVPIYLLLRPYVHIPHILPAAFWLFALAGLATSDALHGIMDAVF